MEASVKKDEEIAKKLLNESKMDVAEAKVYLFLYIFLSTLFWFVFHNLNNLLFNFHFFKKVECLIKEEKLRTGIEVLKLYVAGMKKNLELLSKSSIPPNNLKDVVGGFDYL